jgi:hypothetical protein
MKVSIEVEMNKEYPMYSPFPKARLYKSFIHSNDEDKFKIQLNEFVSHDKIKWIPEKKTDRGIYQPIPSLMVKDGLATIKTNSLAEIENGDIIELRHPALKEKYFVVAETPSIDSVLIPKWRQTFQHLIIKPIEFKEINIKRT